MRRLNFTLRVPNCTVSRTPTDIQDSIKRYRDYFTQIHSNHNINDIINVDQTPVWWNCMQDKQRTVSIKGQRTVRAIKSLPGTNPREKVSVILACYRDGRKLPPAIIVKSSSAKHTRARIKLINGVLVFMNPRTSMANSDIMQRWIKIILRPSTNNGKNILIMDSFRGHLTEEIRQACSDINALRAVIPGGLTSHLQPLDLTVNRSFKSHLRKEYAKHLKAMGNNRQIPAQRLNVLAGAVRQSWNHIRPSVIRNGFNEMFKCMRYA